MNSPKINIIASVGKNGEIGKRGKLIWRISEDLKRFKRLTMGGTLIMGRKTFESIGRPLPGRINVVISRRKNFYPEGVWIKHSPEEALNLARCLGKPVFVIGGASVYKAFMDIADEMQITEVDAGDPDADVRFPTFDKTKWLTEYDSWKESEEGLRFRYVIWRKK